MKTLPKKNPFEKEAMKMAKRLFKHGSDADFVLKAIDTQFKESLTLEQKQDIVTTAIISDNEPENDDVIGRTEKRLKKCEQDIAELINSCGLGEMHELSYLQQIQKHINGALNQITNLNNNI